MFKNIGISNIFINRIGKDKELLMSVCETREKNKVVLLKRVLLVCKIAVASWHAFAFFTLFTQRLIYPIRFSGDFYHFTVANTGYKRR